MAEQRSQTPDGSWEPVTGKKLEITPGATTPLIYANNVGLRMTVFDVLLEFSIIRSTGRDTLEVNPVATVAMSPQHAKALAELLNEHLKSYELEFGKIPEAPPREK